MQLATQLQLWVDTVQQLATKTTFLKILYILRQYFSLSELASLTHEEAPNSLEPSVCSGVIQKQDSVLNKGIK